MSGELLFKKKGWGISREQAGETTMFSWNHTESITANYPICVWLKIPG